MKRARILLKGDWITFDDYYVTNDGLIWSEKTGRFIGHKPGCNERYLRVRLAGIAHFLIHRVVACTFFPNSAHPELNVNHKDGNKHNNAPSNLEWTALADNIRHGKQFRTPAVYSEEERQGRSERARRQHAEGVLNSMGENNPNYKTGEHITIR